MPQYNDLQLARGEAIVRFTVAEARRHRLFFEHEDARMVAKLRRLPRRALNPENVVATVREIRQDRLETFREFRAQFNTTLRAFSRLEADAQEQMLLRSIPEDPGVNRPTAAALAKRVRREPYVGRTLVDWYRDLAAADFRLLRNALQQGSRHGESLEQIVRRVAGTRPRRFRDGALATTRRHVETTVRSAISHAANVVGDSFRRDNPRLFRGAIWRAEGSTSSCRENDGLFVALPGRTAPSGLRLLDDGILPPVHPTCTATMVGVLR